MRRNTLEIPPLLSELVNRGAWQGDLGPEAAQKFSPDLPALEVATVFVTIADMMLRGEREFWENDLTNVGEIDYERAIIIADFGLGSDSVLILYYQGDREPVVMYLKWSFVDHSPRHAWIQTHSSFEELATDLGLVT